MEFDHQRFIQAVRDRIGLDPTRAAVAVRTTFEAIGRALPSDAIAPVAAMLPAELAEHLRRGPTLASAANFLADLAAQEQVSLGFAKEHAQVVLEQLANLYDAPARSLLADRLHPHVPEAATWLTPWHPPEERHPHPAPVDDRSLAGGRPGSRNPLSESAPDRGQHDSLAMTSDPHANTRISTSQGISTEREGTTIAEGRPGSSHPVSEEPD